LDILKKGDVAPAWDAWAEQDAVKFIADGASRTQLDFFASGMVSAGECLGILRAFSNGWELLNGDIMDFGSGIGRHAVWFRRVFRGYVYGIDASEKMIEISKRAPNGIDYRQSQETHIPLDDCSVDYIFSLTVLQHNPRANVREILKEFHRIMRPCGLTCIQLPVVTDPAKVAYPKTANFTAVWHLDEWLDAIKGLFEPVRLATNQHFGYHVMRPIK